ncbi:MAG: S-layer homology domain-containing protein, partial [Chloroflexia bacterium]
MTRRYRLLAVAQLLLFALLSSALGSAQAQAPAATLQQAPTNQATANPEGARDFEDVPPNYTFFPYIRNLYHSGIVSGYPCGGPGEPCGPGNLPYYRPNSGVNRAQMAKFADQVRKKPGFFIDTNTDPLPFYVRTSVANGRGVQGDS